MRLKFTPFFFFKFNRKDIIYILVHSLDNDQSALYI